MDETASSRVDQNGGHPMRRSRKTLLECLRADRLLRWVGALVMVFQVVLAADHLGASAARAVVAEADEAGLGLLTLCHAEGPIEVDAAAPGADRAAPGDGCVLCASPAVVGGPLPLPTVPLPPAPVVVLDSVVPVVARPVSVRSPLRFGALRGPPAALRL